MCEPSDDRLRDHVTIEEIQLVATIMIAATKADGPLPQEQIDTILGVG